MVLFISFLIDCFLSDTPIDEMSILEFTLCLVAGHSAGGEYGKV